MDPSRDLPAVMFAADLGDLDRRLLLLARRWDREHEAGVWDGVRDAMAALLAEVGAVMGEPAEVCV